MVPFKPYFLGQQAPPAPRATSVQKCVRTLDIDEVGKTTRHGSFFQMCGNFSFGDYFKESAIPLRVGAVTSLGRRGRLRPRPATGSGPTVYHDDDEAYEIWHDRSACPAERIQRLGMEENYWSMGVPGPCGPCSELLLRPRPGVRRAGAARRSNDERYLEFWNLVFMQYERGAGGGQGRLPDPRRAARRRPSTPASASSGWRRSCRASTTCTRSTPRASILDKAASS